MKIKVIVSLVLCLFLVSFVSAGFWSDFYTKITGKTITGEVLWDENWCSNSHKCAIGEGDCDKNSHCLIGICSQNVGAKYGKASTMDVCECVSGKAWDAVKKICIESPSGTFVIGIIYDRQIGSNSYKIGINGTSISQWGAPGTATISLYSPSSTLIEYVTLNQGDAKNFSKIPVGVRATNFGYKKSGNKRTFYSAYLDFSEVKYKNKGVWKNGRYITEQACEDSDGGLNYNTKGTIVLMNYPELGDKTSSEDECSGSATLEELYCDASGSVDGVPGFSESIYTCPNRCQNGACI